MPAEPTPTIDNFIVAFECKVLIGQTLHCARRCLRFGYLLVRSWLSIVCYASP